MRKRREGAISVCTVWLWLFLLCAAIPPEHLAARGTAERQPAVLRDQWVLSLTRFDDSALPEEKRTAQNAITRKLAAQLETVNYRLRLSPESQFYEGWERRNTVRQTAQEIARLQETRAGVAFSGKPEWMQKRDMRSADAGIEKLRADLALRESELLLISRQPVFALSEASTNGSYPPPPRRGAERRFVFSQNADAFLSGQISDFHDRFVVKLQLYAMYADAFVYEDEVIFSVEDIDAAVAEIASRLISAMTGFPPATIAVRADPPEAQILVNRSYAGTGSVEALERPAGRVKISISAEGRIPEEVEMDLVPGETADLDVALGILPMAAVTLDAVNRAAENADGGMDTAGISVYNGAMYSGEAPLTLELGAGSLAYVSMESINGQMARAAFTMPELPGTTYNFSLKMIPPEERRVGKARGRYYWSWAAIWGTAVAAWLTTGIYNGTVDAMNYVALNKPDLYNDWYGNRFPQIRDVNTVSLILLAPAVGYTIFEMTRYLGAANRSSVPIVQRDK